MRKFVSALAIAAGLTLIAGPAFAQDDEYPPESSQLTVSESTLSPGESFTVSGDGADPGATVTFTMKRSSSALGANHSLAAGVGLARLAVAVRPQAQSSIPLGSTTANGDGEFSATLTVPSGTDPGVYTVTASSGGEVLAVVTIRVVAAGGVGDLPFTGGNVLPGLAIGATLIVAGGLLLLSLKRRRSAA
jgi:pyruvate/2-oxoacid:ferredoxin oxidoreductase beta subunit